MHNSAFSNIRTVISWTPRPRLVDVRTSRCKLGAPTNQPGSCELKWLHFLSTTTHDHNFKIGLGRKLSPDSPTSTIESGCTGITSGPNLSCASFLSSFSNSSSSRSSPASSRSKTVHIQRLQLFVCTGISTALPDFPPLHRSVKTVVSSTVGKRGCNCFHSILWRYREKTNAPSS